MSVPHGSIAPVLGGHGLPARLSGTTGPASAGSPAISPVDPAPSTPRRRNTGLVLGILGVLVVAGVLGAVQISANLGYDEARSDFDAAVSSSERAADAVVLEHDELRASSDAGGLLLAGDAGVLTDPAARDTLTATVTEATDLSTEVDTLLAVETPGAGEKPGPFWELFAASDELSAQTSDVDAHSAALDAEVPSLEAADASLTEAGIGFLTSAAAAAGTFEAAHISAKNDDVIALRDAASAASLTSALDDTAVSAFQALQDAAAQVVASEQVELAEKAGPLQAVRLEIEAWARSLAPGVLLEFDWNPIVNDAGSNGSMGGLTTWWWDEPDRAVIELSNSVAEQWPADRSRALVAHEVGHAISVKCEDMYDSSTQDSIEKWATAWAISMGFSDDANGVWAYGYPPQSYIDAAYGCR